MQVDMTSLYFEVELGEDGSPEHVVHDGVSNAVVFRINVNVTNAISWTGVRIEDKAYWKRCIISVDTDTPRDDLLVYGVRVVGTNGIRQLNDNSVALHADARIRTIVKLVFNVAKRAERLREAMLFGLSGRVWFA
jgi:hypothetical protein